MNVTSNLSEKIRQIRLQKGLSQENMADMLGLSTTAYGTLGVKAGKCGEATRRAAARTARD